MEESQGWYYLFEGPAVLDFTYWDGKTFFEGYGWAGPFETFLDMKRYARERFKAVKDVADSSLGAIKKWKKP